MELDYFTGMLLISLLLILLSLNFQKRQIERLENQVKELEHFRWVTVRVCEVCGQPFQDRLRLYSCSRNCMSKRASNALEMKYAIKKQP